MPRQDNLVSERPKSLKVYMKIQIMTILLGYSHWGMIANLALFLSALLLLINFAPRDIFPGYQNQRQALSKLKTDKNILGILPNGIRITPQSAGMSIAQDEKTFLILKEMVQKYSPISEEVEWGKIIGIGYSVLSAPVGNYKIDAFKPLYVVEIPNDQSSTLVLKPVGQVEEFEKWFLVQHNSSVNLVAIILLIVGFGIQLLIELGVLGIKTP